MAAQFKNVVIEIDTTGSGQNVLTCPAGKTILVKRLTVQNENGSSSTFYLAFKDASVSSSSYPLDYGTISAAANTNLSLSLVLEESDQILWQTSVADQHIYVSYVELDTGTRQRYSMILNNVTSEDSAHSLLTCPTGSTLITNLVAIYNGSGSSASSNVLAVTDSSASLTKTIDNGTIANTATTLYKYPFVLESGDILKFTNTEQPFNMMATYLEIRKSPLRS